MIRLLEVGDQVSHPTRGKGFITAEVPGHPSVVKVKIGRKTHICRRSDLTRPGDTPAQPQHQPRHVATTENPWS